MVITQRFWICPVEINKTFTTLTVWASSSPEDQLKSMPHFSKECAIPLKRNPRQRFAAKNEKDDYPLGDGTNE